MFVRYLLQYVLQVREVVINNKKFILRPIKQQDAKILLYLFNNFKISNTISFTCSVGNICCLSRDAAMGCNSVSENVRHKFFNFKWTSGNTKVDMFRTPEKVIEISFETEHGLDE